LRAYQSAHGAQVHASNISDYLPRSPVYWTISGACLHLPMQNVANTAPSSASLEVSPVISPSA
jgi:hypothetical protein